MGGTRVLLLLLAVILRIIVALSLEKRSTINNTQPKHYSVSEVNQARTAYCWFGS
jgi:hypothetical protein